VEIYQFDGDVDSLSKYLIFLDLKEIKNEKSTYGISAVFTNKGKIATLDSDLKFKIMEYQSNQSKKEINEIPDL
jgi:hypothetical protein